MADTDESPRIDPNQFLDHMLLTTAVAFGWNPPFEYRDDMSIDEPGICAESVKNTLERARNVLLAPPNARESLLRVGLEGRPDYERKLAFREWMIGVLEHLFRDPAGFLEDCISTVRERGRDPTKRVSIRHRGHVGRRRYELQHSPARQPYQQ